MTDYKPIGAGGFGTIFMSSQRTVIKALYNKNNCDNAETEFNKQIKVYNTFESIKHIQFDNPLIDDAKNIIKVSKPINYDNRSIMINNNQYACYFSMDYLYGLPLWMYKDIVPQALKKLNADFEIMLHLSFNSHLKEDFYGAKPSSVFIDEHNPPRGYFINENSEFLKKLQKYYKFPYNNNQLRFIIGFIYGVLFFHANLIPFDIEITLGYHNAQFYINIVDFGLVIDLDDLEHAPKHFYTEDVKNIINNNESLEEYILNQLSLDMYCDISNDNHCLQGWNIAKNVFL
ncbi:MAG TPA: hypothetical protein VLG50_07155 [Candidatus Saccharimonadales bacterium]|nr:hypothetical protein [Candidatus Saccharimonadales bacterium]